MEHQDITIQCGSDNRCELETWLDENDSSKYYFESIKKFDCSQLKWATEERKRINHAHNVVIPEIKSIINNDIHWKNKYRTELPCINYLGILPSEMEDLNKYDLEGHIGDKPVPTELQRRRSRKVVSIDGHYLKNYASHIMLNGVCIDNVAHLWGSNIKNRNNIRLAKRIGDCKHDINSLNYKVDKMQSHMADSIDNIKHIVENAKSCWDSQIEAQHKIFITQLVFDNRIQSFQCNISEKISDVESEFCNALYSIESKITDIETMMNNKICSIQKQYDRVVNELEKNLQDNNDYFKRKCIDYEVRLCDVKIRQNYIFNAIFSYAAMIGLYYIFCSII